VDPAYVSLALRNLVTNALKNGVREPGDPIRIGGESADDETRPFVSDRGPGIAPEHHQGIFRLFQRLDTDREGTGIGLAIVRKIADVHGGRCWVESVPGKGAAFWIAFPATPDEEDDSDDDASAEGGPAASGAPANEPAARGTGGTP
jgi:signal transduction histidine kinase